MGLPAGFVKSSSKAAPGSKQSFKSQAVSAGKSAIIEECLAPFRENAALLQRLTEFVPEHLEQYNAHKAAICARFQRSAAVTVEQVHGFKDKELGLHQARETCARLRGLYQSSLDELLERCVRAATGELPPVDTGVLERLCTRSFYHEPDPASSDPESKGSPHLGRAVSSASSASSPSVEPFRPQLAVASTDASSSLPQSAKASSRNKRRRGHASAAPQQERQQSAGVTVAQDGRRLLKKRENFPKNAVALLECWLSQHKHDPYPTVAEKEQLSKETGLTYRQVGNWFINIRMRRPQELTRVKDVAVLPK
jgi:hypothetical protein